MMPATSACSKSPDSGFPAAHYESRKACNSGGMHSRSAWPVHPQNRSRGFQDVAVICTNLVGFMLSATDD